ncbi:hypothetical protein RQN30_02295 [Arcanobacterium hippocoleae]
MDENQINDSVQEEFLNTLTMVEIAKLEANFGIQIDNVTNLQFGPMFSALASIALDRLGIHANQPTIEAMTLDEVTEIFAAAQKHAPDRPAEVYEILRQVRGKFQSDSTDSSEQSPAA